MTTKSRDLGNVAQSIATSLPTSLGSAGQTIVVNSGENGLEFGSAGSSVTTVQNLTGLGNITSPAAGDMALVTDLNNLYVRKTAGWYLIATVTNQGPQSVSVALSGGGSGTSSAYTLATDGSTTSTATGSADPDREADTLTWSASAGSGTAFASTLSDGGSAVNITTSANTSTVLATISQSSNVFTITPSSSSTAPGGGTFLVTFAVTDGINTSVDNTTTFTLEFPADYSAATSLGILYPSGLSQGDKIGYAIDMDADGDTLVVGSWYPNSYQGEAHVYERTSATAFTYRKLIVPSDIANSDYFSRNVAVSGDGNYIVSGSSYDDTYNTNTGSVYIWYKGTGNWSGGSQQAKKNPSTYENGGNFGYSVAIDNDGDTMIVGAPFESVGGTNRGACYIFTRTGTASWSQQARLLANDYTSYTYGALGIGVAISGDGNTVAIGSEHINSSSQNVGAVYIFTRSGSSWTQQKKLNPNTTETGTRFSNNSAIAISSDGNYVIVGAEWADVGSNTNAGAAYIFYKGATSWASTGAQQARLEASDGNAYDGFGVAVDISDDGRLATIGSYTHDYPNGAQQGACYVFNRTGTSWSQQAKLTENFTYGLLGTSVAIAGDESYVAAGIPQYNSNRGGFKVWKG